MAKKTGEALQDYGSAIASPWEAVGRSVEGNIAAIGGGGKDLLGITAAEEAEEAALAVQKSQEELAQEQKLLIEEQRKAAQEQRDKLKEKEAIAFKEKQLESQRLTRSFNARRRGLLGRRSLIATSERGVV